MGEVSHVRRGAVRGPPGAILHCLVGAVVMIARILAAALAMSLVALWMQSARMHRAEMKIAGMERDAAKAERDWQQAARADEQRSGKASAEATDNLMAILAANLPAAEARTHETIERIRVVYRDRPVPAECRWPDGVRDELTQAIHRANTASR